MDIRFVNRLARLKLFSLKSSDDLVDKMSYKWTTAILLVFCMISLMRQYVFVPIQCWTPAEWKKAWEEFTESFCWIQDTYFSKIDTGPDRDTDTRYLNKISYFQWVPFVMGVQMFMFYLPHMLWKFMGYHAGINFSNFLKRGKSAGEIDNEKRSKMAGFIANELMLLSDNRQQHQSDKRNLMSKVSLFGVLNRKSGYHMFMVYVTIKIAYIVNAILNLYIMQIFIGIDSYFFGLTILQDLYMNRQWQSTGIFPRVTFCDVYHRDLANPISRTVMCVLPGNMLHEKMYIFLWFWIFFVMVMTVMNLVMWIMRLLCQAARTEQYICKILETNIFSREKWQSISMENVKDLCNNYLRMDGIFALMLIRTNVGEIAVHEIIVKIWNIYLKNLQDKIKQIETY